MTTLMIALVAALSLGTVAPAVAQETPQAEADLRCYAVSRVLEAMASEGDLVLAEGTIPSQQLLSASRLMTVHYLDRLRAREPGVDWMARGTAMIFIEGQAESEELMVTDLPRCLNELVAG